MKQTFPARLLAKTGRGWLTPVMHNLSTHNVVSSRETTCFILALIVALCCWFALTLLTFGTLIILLGLMAFLVWMTNGLLVASIRSEAVAVHRSQLGGLDETLERVCQRLDVKKKPDLYVMQSGGVLNAFATRHTGRHFVVIYSDMLEAFGPDSPEMEFLLGHEIGHIRQNHLMKRVLLAPALFLPLLGPAYSRACETTCDRFGALAANSPDASLKAMMTLAGGKEAGRTMDSGRFAEQNRTHRGFFVSWYELISGYPTLSRRVRDLEVLAGNVPAKAPSRHPLAWLFALFTFGGGFGGRGSIFTTLILIYMISILSALSIPAVTGALQAGQAMQDLSNARHIALAMQEMAQDGAAQNNPAYGYPADAGLTTTDQLKARLIDGGYLTSEEAAQLHFDRLLFGNVSRLDDPETILIRSNPTLRSRRAMVLLLDGNGRAVSSSDKDIGLNPDRDPAYLSP